MTGYNDPINYNSFINYNGGIVPPPSPAIITGAGGEGSDSWSRYLAFLAKKKKKEFKERAEKLEIAPSKARKIAEIATQAALEHEPIYDGHIINQAAQNAIIDVYEEVWQQMAVQKKEIYVINKEVDRIKEENEEEEFFTLMM